MLMLHEQAASYAAQAYGYMTGRPGACIVVTGLVLCMVWQDYKCQQNCFWPTYQSVALLKPTEVEWVLSKKSDRFLSQVHFVNFHNAVYSVERIPYYVEMATCHSIYGCPGACYIDMPDDIIQVNVSSTI